MIDTRMYASVNEALACISLELIQADAVDVINAVGDKVVTHEIANFHAMFKPGYNNVCTLPLRKFPYKGAQAEFLWYMTGKADANAVAKYLPNWLNYADVNGCVNSNYGVYWHKYIPGIIEELKRDKSSRRACMNIYHAGNADKFNKDTPCTLSLQFLIRNDKLCLICTMRSNDIWYGFSIDQFCNSLLQQLVLHSLQQVYPNLQLGWYAHNTGSMHVYMSESKGNSNISGQTLFELYTQYMTSNDAGKAFTIPDEVSFDNFWSIDNVVFDAERYNYFKSVQ